MLYGAWDCAVSFMPLRSVNLRFLESFQCSFYIVSNCYFSSFYSDFHISVSFSRTRWNKCSRPKCIYCSKCQWLFHNAMFVHSVMFVLQYFVWFSQYFSVNFKQTRISSECTWDCKSRALKLCRQEKFLHSVFLHLFTSGFSSVYSVYTISVIW